MVIQALISKSDFDKALKNKDFKGKLVVVDFFATWCGPCKQLAPKLEAMAEEFPDIKFFKVDVDENEESPEEYEVSAMPTVAFFKDGQLLKKEDGSSELVVGTNENAIREAIQRHSAQ